MDEQGVEKKDPAYEVEAQSFGELHDAISAKLAGAAWLSESTGLAVLARTATSDTWLPLELMGRDTPLEHEECYSSTTPMYPSALSMFAEPRALYGLPDGTVELRVSALRIEYSRSHFRRLEPMVKDESGAAMPMSIIDGVSFDLAKNAELKGWLHVDAQGILHDTPPSVCKTSAQVLVKNVRTGATSICAAAIDVSAAAAVEDARWVDE